MSSDPSTPAPTPAPTPAAATTPERGLPERGLPPVTPPSGKFIAQLFLVPGTIVFLAVMLLLMFRYLFGGGYTPEQFLRQLDNPNADIRWRGASDLAQVLERPESLAMRCDVDFALLLARRLKVAIDDLNAEEQRLKDAAAKLPEAEQQLFWRKLAEQRKYVTFLTAATARMHVPVAIPALCDLAQRSGSPDAKNEVHLRRQALWAIGIVGDNLGNFKKLPQENQSSILERLRQEARGTDVLFSAWARTALYYLDKTPDGGEVVKVDQVLAKCADVDDPYARELVALALRFWEGDLVEPTILKLSHDDGHGKLIRTSEVD